MVQESCSSSAQSCTPVNNNWVTKATITTTPSPINVKNALSRFHSALRTAPQAPRSWGVTACHSRSKAASNCEKMPIAPTSRISETNTPLKARSCTPLSSVATSSAKAGDMLRARKSNNCCRALCSARRKPQHVT